MGSVGVRIWEAVHPMLTFKQWQSTILSQGKKARAAGTVARKTYI